jgi:TatD DNase family protein
MLIDTHAHIYLDRFDDDRAAVMDRARAAGVEAVVLPAIDVPSIQQAATLCDAYADADDLEVYAMTALHPSETEDATEADFDAVAAWTDDPRVVAVGESGLDYYWDRSFDAEQQRFFRRHIRLAIAADLPLVIHNREATEDVLAILREERAASDHPERLRGILHCFVDPPAVAEAAAAMGFLVGLGGLLTFKNSDVDAHAEALPLEQVVLETDAPFLAPVPHRGKRNEPAFVRHVAEHLAEVKGLPLEEVARVTTANARRIYGI